MKKESYYQVVRKDVVPFIDGHPRRILEVGCAEGSFRSLLSWQTDYWGVELSPEAAKIASERLDHVFTGSFDENISNIPDNYFDLIVCNDVIEHMPDACGFFLKICKKLSGGGRVIGSVPNVRFFTVLLAYLFHNDWEYTDSGILDSTHLRFFTSKSLARTFVTQGWSVEALRFINPAGHNSRHSFLASFARTFIGILLGRSAVYWQIGFRVRPINVETGGEWKNQ